MEKINFVNNSTPYLSADNLNQLQSNVENSFKNEKTESTTDTYSCDYINKLNLYSTEEQVIGTWINGKPIYRKVIKISNIKLENGVQIPTNIVNIEEITKYEAIFNLEGDIYNNFIFDQNTGLILTSRLSGSNITIVANDFYIEGNNRIYTFIIEYTKTTD